VIDGRAVHSRLAGLRQIAAQGGIDGRKHRYTRTVRYDEEAVSR
jgi:hypothetical protein